MSVEPQNMCLVLYDGTKSISRVFSKWSRSKSIGQYQGQEVLVNINVIFILF